MNRTASRACLVRLCIALAACGGDAAETRDRRTDGGSEVTMPDSARSEALDASTEILDAGAATDADPTVSADAEQTASLSAESWALLRKLRYDDGPPPPDPSNKFADLPAARAFGQRLFFASTLSGRLLSRDNDGSPPTLGKVGEAGRISCASCHVPQGGFYDTRSHHQQISLASQWTRRRSPGLLESAFLPVYNWDGRHDSTWSQALGVMESAVEFNSGRLFVAQQVFRLYKSEYEGLFGALPALDDASRFPQLTPTQVGCDEGAQARCHGKPGDGAEFDGLSPALQEQVTRVSVNVAKAISAYVRLLRCGPGRFDKWLDGQPDALTPSEQNGAALFVGKGDCVRCHSGPRLTDGAFHNVGLRPATVAVAFTDTGDRGAAEGLPLALLDPLRSAGTFSDGDRKTLPPAVTPAHEGAFRTPTLRCASRAPSFMHTGQLRTLEQVVAFFDQGGHPAPGYPGVSEIAALKLSEQERRDLSAFLRTLDGAGPASDHLSAPR